MPTATAMPSLMLLAMLLSTLLILPQLDALISTINYQTSSSCSDQRDPNSLLCQLEVAKLRIDRLESIIEERIRDVNGKNKYLSDCDKKIEGLTVEIDNLKAVLSEFGNGHSRENEKLTALEEEVRLLWAESRKKNFEVHNLELNALDAERKLQEVTFQVGQLKEIVNEQWIQIQQLEQAAHMAEMRTSKFKKELLRRCLILKFFIDTFDGYSKMLNGILDPSAPRDGSVLTLCKSKVLQIFSAAKHYHYQLQDLVKHAMKSNELTEAFAHKELVFFVASAVVTFPLMAAIFLLTQLV